MVKNPLANARDAGSIPGLGRFPGGGRDSPLGKFHGQRSPVSYSPCDCKESDMTEQLSMRAHRHCGLSG